MKKIVFLAFAIMASINAYAQKAEMYSTTSEKRWVKSKVENKKNVVDNPITIYMDSLLQNVDGFGGTFNEIGWDAMLTLPEETRSEIMQSLFGSDGVNFSLGRTPVGCSDYSFGYYSYNDVRDDYEMRNFSIDRDRFILMPYIKEALKLRPDLILWASPWTPPTWMKVNEHYSQKSSGIEGTEIGHNRMNPCQNMIGNVTGFKMTQGHLSAYAKYFSKYVQAYRDNGIKISMVMPQNEIAWTPCWPSCTWRPEDLAIFVTQYLGPQFEKDSLDTDIYMGTINYPNPDYIRTFMKHKDIGKYIKGVGVQWTGMRALPHAYREYPSFKYMQTENMCGNSENDWSALEKTWKAVIHCFNNGVNSYMYWNMILNETCKSWWDWAQNALIIIDRNTNGIKYTDEYYLMKHLSHFVQPGSRLIKVSDNSNTLAFNTKDGKIVIVTYNPNDSEIDTGFKMGDKTLAVKLRPRSINTVVCHGIGIMDKALSKVI
ncbi:glycoside hydrolase family 30 beta sandwich domain-containing protein [uncultured Bacteroides sp.]|uniref:glycoside hydrolase family 30 protein n=1 Tax=uncultured Bacteroides sp. TaxID=162156 RepID=UPI00280B557F|nr:glycoside hydrolase family 30 beta sandwich domain-containing protein [uncultured Bacteroides sp.]